MMRILRVLAVVLLLSLVTGGVLTGARPAAAVSDTECEDPVGCAWAYISYNPLTDSIKVKNNTFDLVSGQYKYAKRFVHANGVLKWQEQPSVCTSCTQHFFSDKTLDCDIPGLWESTTVAQRYIYVAEVSVDTYVGW